MPNCNALVVHLPRHLHDIHHWNDAKARNAVQVYGLRQPHDIAKQKAAKSLTIANLKRCPIDKCAHLVKQLSSQLFNFHHLDSSSDFYRSMLVLSRKRRCFNSDLRSSLSDEDIPPNCNQSDDVINSADENLNVLIKTRSKCRLCGHDI